MNTRKEAGKSAGGNAAKVSDQLLERSRTDADAALRELGSRSSGLTAAEAEGRLKRHGLNEIAREKRQSPLARLGNNVKNPLVLLLVALGVLSYLTGDRRATTVIFAHCRQISTLPRLAKRAT